MDEQIPKIPDSADELISKVDSAKAELAAPQNVIELKRLTRQMTTGSNVEGDDEFERRYKTAHYKLIDNREVVITDYLNDRDGLTDVLITVIEQVKDKTDKEHAIRKRYFISGDEMELDTDSFMDVSSKDVSDLNSDDEYLGDEGSLTQEEVEAAHNQLYLNRGMNWETGIHNPTNEDVVNLMRLLKTAEPIVPQKS